MRLDLITIFIEFSTWAVLMASLKIIGSGLLTAIPLARDSEVKPNLGFDHKHGLLSKRH